jgi:hypothetical protein
VKGMCKWHYARKLKGLDLDRPLVVRSVNKNTKCVESGCENNAKTMTRCAMHYNRLIKGIPMDQPVPYKNNGAQCNADGCTRVAEARGWCRTHASRIRKGKDTATPVRTYSYDGAKCKFDLCDAGAKSLGYCHRHYAVSSRYGQAGLEALRKYAVNGCAMCGRMEPDAGRPAVDHDHSCCKGREVCGNCVRGALCMKCNLALGWLEDLGLMKKAASYLRNTSSVLLQRREA